MQDPSEIQPLNQNFGWPEFVASNTTCYNLYLTPRSQAKGPSTMYQHDVDVREEHSLLDRMKAIFCCCNNE